MKFVQSLSHVCPPLSPQSLLKFMPIESVMLFNHLFLCCPFILLSSIFPIIRVFSNESTLHITVSGQSMELQLQHQYCQKIFKVDFLLD